MLVHPNWWWNKSVCTWHPKGPPGQPAQEDYIIKDDPVPVHPVIFDSLDSSVVRAAVLKATGAAGPSGVDA